MNSSKPISIKSLQGVENTLLFPLYSRALDCKSKHPILNDISSLEMIEKIDFNFEIFSEYIDELALLGHTLRSKYFDQKVKDFLLRFPIGIIISLGSGLDNRFNRIDNESVTYVDIDLPEVIELRTKLIERNDRNLFISSSILNYNWLEEIETICQSNDQHFLIIAEAVFMYIPKDDIIALIQKIVSTFPNSEFVFDIYSNFMVKQMKHEKALTKYQSEFKWSLKNAHEIEQLIPSLRLVSEWNFFKSPETHKGRFRILRFIPFIKNMSKIAHYKNTFNKKTS